MYSQCINIIWIKFHPIEKTTKVKQTMTSSLNRIGFPIQAPESFAIEFDGIVKIMLSIGILLLLN